MTDNKFKDYLENLPKWDGQNRLDTILKNALGIKNDPIVRWSIRALLKGIIGRTYGEDIPNNKLIVLVDDGGGKSVSAFWEALLDDGFTTRVNMKLEGIELLGRIKDKALVECTWDETDRSHQIEKLRNFIVCRGDDGETRKYMAVATAPSKDSIIFDYSDSKMEVLPIYMMDTKNRRHRIRKLLDKSREQVWAQALQAYNENPSIAEPPKIKGAYEAQRHFYNRQEGKRKKNSFGNFKRGLKKKGLWEVRA